MKKLLLILLCLPMMILGQISYVPDDNFEDYLEANGMGDGIANNDQVLTSNINLVTYLDVNDEYISDLTGIEDFTALQYLECGDNELTTLDVTQNTALTDLYCGYNELISLNVSGAPLQNLVCNSNELANLDVSQNTNLIALYCMNNNLASLDVSQLSSLTDLVCTNNDLINLDISGASSLTYILCEGNLLSSLDVSDASLLNYLDCSDNQLTSLDLRNGNNLYLSAFTSANNPNLYCISVDDPVYSTANWTLIDSWTSFGNQCTPLACTPDLQYVSAGLYPLALADADVGSQYNEAITIITPLDTTVDYLGSTMVLNVIDVTLDSVVGLPPGFSYSCDPSSCSIPGGSSGCLSIYSTINPTISDTGLYQIDIYTTTTVDLGVMGTISSQDVVDSYSIMISQLGCTDSLAYNYDPLAVVDDGSCTICSASSTGVNQLTFTKQDNADWHQASNRDLITPTCELTRGQSGGIFNYATQVDVYDNNGNENIKYAMGTYDNYSSPWFSYFNSLGNYTSTSGMSSLAGETVTIHILDDDVYFELEFNSWSSGQQGGFSYTRTAVCNEVPLVYGCTDPIAPNYDATAIVDDGSCIYYGCTDPTAPNYDPIATVDDQSCIDCSTFISSITLSNYNGYNIVCYGDDDNATAEVSGGVGPYSYSWSTGSTYVTSNLSSTEIVVPASYSVTITDNDGCQTSESFIVTGPAPLQSSVSVTSNYNGQEISCFGASDGEATINSSGGTPGYTYSWITNPIQSTQTATGLSATVANGYICVVTDANGCSNLTNVVITEPLPIDTLSTFSTPTNCNGDVDGSATVTADPLTGTPPFSYSWNDILSQQTQTAINLTAQTYECEITDINGCSSPLNPVIVTVNEPDFLVATVSQTINVSCTGDATGAITLTTAGGTGPYSYEWFDDSGNPIQGATTASNLVAGTYTCEVIDNNGCLVSVTAIITEPANLLTAIVTSGWVSCAGGSDGEATANASGGTPTYSYLWSDANSVVIGTSDTETGLEAGIYTCMVTDANGCSFTTDIEVFEPTSLIVVSSTSLVSCNGDSDGEATANASGGTPTYSYLWSDGQTTATASSLFAGTYSCVVTDVNGCIVPTGPITIGEPAMIDPVAISSIPVSCNGFSDGQATVSVVGGTPGYIYTWNDPTNQTTQTATGLSSGSYTCLVTDANGCIVPTGAIAITIGEPDLLVAIVQSVIDVSCTGDATGAITLATTGGTGTYSYLWSNGQTSAIATGLSLGTYTCTVTDANGCAEITAPITITEPASALAVSISVLSDETCNGSNDASAMANVSGGVGPYTYSWSNAATSDLLSGLSAGVYTVEVTDGNGCIAASTTNINAALLLNVSTSYNSPTCNSTTIGVANDGTATVNVSGGAGGYTYLWDDALSQTTPTASALTSGTYNCTILDANGCAASAQVIISEPSADITATFTNTDIACFGASTGASIINAIGGTAPLDYSWSPATSNSTDIQNQVAGTYVCNVSDATGCITPFTTTISESPLLVSNNIISSCDSALIGNTYYTISGWYPDTLTSVNGCDSIVNTTLTINNSTSNTTTIIACDSYTWSVNGNTYTSSDNYTDVSTNSAGCTHTEILLLTINQSTSSYDTLSVAASIVWNGMPLNASGDYSVILTNSVSCDSIANLNLTVTIPSGLFNVTNSDKSLLMITDMLGQETPYRRNTPLFYIYDDGTVEKRVVID